MALYYNNIALLRLNRELRVARAKMEQLWEQKGHTDDEVLAASIEVDNLLNEYKYLTKNNKFRRVI